MDAKVIKECTDLSLAGKITFPEVVGKLIGIGVERYIADLTNKQKLYFGIDNKTHSEKFSFEGPEVAKTFDMTEVKNAIKEIQQQKIDYKTFLSRIMNGGCCHYEVFISGKQAVYFGRDGSQYIELFPKQ